MKICILTPIYPNHVVERKGATPVVHYFARQWVMAGHDVRIYHIVPKWPLFYYGLGRLLSGFLSYFEGFTVSYSKPVEKREIIENVDVIHVPLKKYIPHSLYSKNQQTLLLNKILYDCSTEGTPDVFIGHWCNPCLELLASLKDVLKVRTCLVFHGFNHDVLKLYKGRYIDLISRIDLLGFRNNSMKLRYESLCGRATNSFIVSSGVPSLFYEDVPKRDFSNISNYTYVGALIRRKHPIAVYKALCEAYDNQSFNLRYIGTGLGKLEIMLYRWLLRKNNGVHFAGRVPRTFVLSYLRRSDVFVMVSQSEVFGLVYLEAMAQGCITIASKGEGMDGIIKDGVNGFLCKAGDSHELASVITRILTLSPDRLKIISRNAIETAKEFSDEKVANTYINNISKMLIS